MEKLFSMKYLADRENDIIYKDLIKLYAHVTNWKIRFVFKLGLFLIPFICLTLLITYFKFILGYKNEVWLFLWVGLTVICIIFANYFLKILLFKCNISKIRSKFLPIYSEVELSLYEDKIIIIANHNESFSFEYPGILETDNVILLGMNHVIPKRQIDSGELSVFKEILKKKAGYQIV